MYITTKKYIKNYASLIQVFFVVIFVQLNLKLTHVCVSLVSIFLNILFSNSKKKKAKIILRKTFNKATILV